MRVAQYVACPSTNDAVSRFVFLLDRAFHSEGLSSQVFADVIEPSMIGRVRSFADDLDPSDLLIYHASTATPLADHILDRPGRLVVYYHNVTPSKYFEPFWPDFARLMTVARLQIASLADRADRGLAASVFSAADLTAWGYSRVDVVPLAVDPDLYRAGAAPARARSSGPIRILVIGRMCPHKAIHDSVRLAATATRADVEVEIDIVGSPHTPAYVWAVKRYRSVLGCSNVTFHGSLVQADLNDLFERGDVLLSLSRHEGFGVPLLEAMAHGLPVVALDAGGVAETCGNAAVLLESTDVRVALSAIESITSDEALCHTQTMRGYERWQAAIGAPRVRDCVEACLS